MRRLTVLVLMLSVWLPALAQNYSIPAGASTATIQGTINNAANYSGSGNVTITVAAGVSSSLQQITFTCPQRPTSIVGPPTGYPYAWNARPTAIWRGAGLDDQLMYWPACSVGRSILYMELDGNQPASGGGGIEIAMGSSNSTIMYDFIHGNEENYPTPCAFDTAHGHPATVPYNTYYCYDDTAANLIELDGYPNATATTQVNTVIQYNILGNPVQNYPTNQATTDGVVHAVSTSLGDCVNVQQWSIGPGWIALTQKKMNLGFDSTGGNCVGVAIRGGTTGTWILDNEIVNQEQGVKWFECGATSTTVCYQINDKEDRNYIHGIHRAGTEAQQTSFDSGNVSNMEFEANVYRDPKDPFFGSFPFTLPEGNYQNGAPRVNEDNNLVMVDCGNADHPNYCAQHNTTAPAFEFWASNLGTANHNLMQFNSSSGGGGIVWGFGGYSGYSNCTSGEASTSCWQANYNTCEGAPIGTNGNPGQCVATEGEQSTNPPQIAFNAVAATPSTKTSNTPSISPVTGTSFNGSLTVTLSIAGYASTVPLPQGNQNVWYTTDGSTPVPKSGTAKFYQGPFTITTTTTVKAVGMFGGIAQPGSYASSPGMGFAPSAVITATYTTSGTAITLTSVSNACPQNSLTAGGATQTCAATAHYSDGVTDDVTAAADARGYGPALWASSATAIATISAVGVVTPIAAGSTNISASLGVLNSNVVGISVVGTMGGGGGGAGGTMLVGGQSQNDVTGSTYPGSTNDLYFIAPAITGGTIPGNCHMILPGAVTSGKHYDCLLISAPSSTTEATTYTCLGTYTTTSSSAPGSITIPMTGCPSTLASGSAWWLATITDDPAYPISMGFYDCGSTGSCNSTVPTTGVGTYQGRYLSGVTYGSYSSLSSTFTGTNPNQPSQWMDLTSTAPVLVSAYQANVGSVNQMVSGGGYQMHAYCVYSDSVIMQCDGTADARGDVVTAWGVSSSVVLSIGAVGSGMPGVVTGLAFGTATTTCSVGSTACSAWTWKITNVPATADSFLGMTLKGMSVN